MDCIVVDELSKRFIIQVNKLKYNMTAVIIVANLFCESYA